MLFLGTSFLLLSYSLVEASRHGGRDFSASNALLNWAPCDLDFPESLQGNITGPIDCATLEVPLDYTDPNCKQTLELQLVKVNATNEPFKGSVITNPGGPGGSGVEDIALSGSTFTPIFGGHFDVIGFDARGTGRTIPFACGLANSTTTADSHSRRSNSTVLLPQGDLWEILQSKAWNDGGVFADGCYEGNQEIGRFLGTAFVARDMLQIVDALDEDGLLRYWGRSYGTSLGQTFAAMFPDRIDRMLLDSVQLADNYNSGSWLTAGRDTDDSLLNFFTECVNAGASVCPLANYTGPATSPEDLMAALSEVFQELLDDPVILPDHYPVSPWWQPGGVSLLLELKSIIFNLLYSPSQFPILIQVITSALARNWEVWMAPPPDTGTEPQWSLGANAVHGIACSDASFRASSPGDMYSLLQAQSRQSRFADGLLPTLWPCAQWPFEAAERYEGNFQGLNTSFPIMFVNGPHDPVTSLSGAWEASAGFEGSRLLVHNGHGHGMTSQPSTCTINAVIKYFEDGTLPEPGTVCEPDMTAFELIAAQANGTTVEARGEGNEESPFMRDLYDLARKQRKDDLTARYFLDAMRKEIHANIDVDWSRGQAVMGSDSG